MSHIEFVGPPGAGKSTIYGAVIDNPKFFGALQEDAVKRWMLRKARKRYRILYRMTPGFLRSLLVDSVIEYRLRRAVFDDFVRSYPNFPHVLSLILNEARYQPETLHQLVKRCAETYQIGVETVEDDETLFIDEGFSQSAVSILWRFDDRQFPLSDYFQRTPTPRLLIYVDAPVDTCIQRQQKRGNVPASKEWVSEDIQTVQYDLDNICQQVVTAAEKHTQVLTINNTGGIDTAVDRIRSALSN
ncbi:uncharacterized protein NP_1932A [Natronomonas pharaonis DSM 2160]|uniref:Thymidylate kinase n=1 Tax=Natronomonas pharaonis (strain ATCC 35678 / DSM 2160 / CIP 103997 / JCM 8858 / NBRC 14720 / NCIMB 2260 / Gabara) TaxID=348780 RepID=A0A1U7EVK9_NATPD|nr:AAA family ATPase [Natronomonas pharaonis]CAI49057.1 uncharacterized protein NP_1932A [Natronomonas pharaonis DSM 2160]